MQKLQDLVNRSDFPLPRPPMCSIVQYWPCSVSCWEWLYFEKKMFLFVRTPWKRCCFSGDGEYIVAGSARQHALYIWEKSIGNLVKILHGTRGELLLDVAVISKFRESCKISICIHLKCANSFSPVFHSVASCPSNNCLHLQWSCVHLGPESSGELASAVHRLNTFWKCLSTFV